MMIKVSLLLSIPTIKRLQAKKQGSPILGQISTLLGLNSGLILNLSLLTPKDTPLRDFTSFELSRVKIH